MPPSRAKWLIPAETVWNFRYQISVSGCSWAQRFNVWSNRLNGSAVLEIFLAAKE